MLSWFKARTNHNFIKANLKFHKHTMYSSWYLSSWYLRPTHDPLDSKGPSQCHFPALHLQHMQLVSGTGQSSTAATFLVLVYSPHLCVGVSGTWAASSPTAYPGLSLGLLTLAHGDSLNSGVSTAAEAPLALSWSCHSSGGLQDLFIPSTTVHHPVWLPAWKAALPHSGLQLLCADPEDIFQAPIMVH